MFSGKTTELLRRIRRFKSIEKRVCVINHHSDTRTGDKIETHYGDNVESLKYVHLMNFVNGKYKGYEYDVICIDEAQFFGDLHMAVKILVDVYNVQVIVFGLSGDYKRKNFGQMHCLVPWAEDIVLCKAYCGMCKDGTTATFTKRLGGGKSQVDVGASDKYVAVCRKCYLKV